MGVTQLISHRNLMLLGSSKNYNEMKLDMKQQSCFSTKKRERERRENKRVCKIYIFNKIPHHNGISWTCRNDSKSKPFFRESRKLTILIWKQEKSSYQKLEITKNRYFNHGKKAKIKEHRLWKGVEEELGNNYFSVYWHHIQD